MIDQLFEGIVGNVQRLALDSRRAGRGRGRHRHPGEHLQLDERPPARNRRHAGPGREPDARRHDHPPRVDPAVAGRRRCWGCSWATGWSACWARPSPSRPAWPSAPCNSSGTKLVLIPGLDRPGVAGRLSAGGRRPTAPTWPSRSRRRSDRLFDAS